MSLLFAEADVVYRPCFDSEVDFQRATHRFEWLRRDTCQNVISSVYKGIVSNVRAAEGSTRQVGGVCVTTTFFLGATNHKVRCKKLVIQLLGDDKRGEETGAD